MEGDATFFSDGPEIQKWEPQEVRRSAAPSAAPLSWAVTRFYQSKETTRFEGHDHSNWKLEVSGRPIRSGATWISGFLYGIPERKIPQFIPQMVERSFRTANIQNILSQLHGIETKTPKLARSSEWRVRTLQPPELSQNRKFWSALATPIVGVGQKDSKL